MKKSLVKILSIIMSTVIVTPSAVLAKDYSYKTLLVKQDFSACDSFEDTGFKGDSTGTFDGSEASPWYIEEDENGVRCLAADLTSSSMKAYLSVGNEDWENYTVSVSFVMTPDNTGVRNGVSVYTRSKGIIHTYGSKSCSYFRHRFSNTANYSNYYCCWVKLNDGANEAVFENNWYDRTDSSALKYGVMQTVTVSAENTASDDGKVSVKQTVTLNDTFTSSKTKVYPSSSPVLSGKAAFEFLEMEGGHVRIYDITVTGTAAPSVSLSDEEGNDAVLGTDGVIKATASVSENADKEIFPVLINAAYGDGVLTDISTDKADFSVQSTFSLEADVESPSADGCVTAMLWNGISGEALSDSCTKGSLENTYETKGMSFDSEEVLHITGNISDITDDTEADTINILVTNPNTDITSLDSADDDELFQSICCVYQLKTDENGDFGISVKPNLTGGAKYGEYKAYIKADNGSEKTFSAVLQNPALLGETIEEFNNKSFASDEELKAYIDSKAEIFGLDLSQLESIKDTAAVYRALADKRPYDKSNPAIAQDFGNAVMYQRFNEAEGEDMLSFIESSSEFDLTSMTNYTEYTALSREDKVKLMEYLDELKPVSGFEGVVECIDKNIILYIISGKDYTWNGMYEILVKYKSHLGIDFTAYNKLADSDKKSVMTDLKSKLKIIDSADDIKPLFDKLVAAVPVRVTASGGGSSGGGGSSSKSSSSVSMPLVVSQFDNERAEETPAERLVSEKFADLQGYEWAKESIEYLADEEIIEGNDGMFLPQNNITREEFVKMAANAFGLDMNGQGCSFEDVLSEEWYYPYISAAVSAGLINGVDEKNFGLGLDITREQLAAVMYRYIESKGIKLAEKSALDSFSDSDRISAYASESVENLRKAGILNGDDENRFNPSSCATRAEAAVIIHRIIVSLQNPVTDEENQIHEESEADKVQASEKETGVLKTDDAGQLIKNEGEE